LFAGYLWNRIAGDDVKSVPIIGDVLATAANVTTLQIFLHSRVICIAEAQIAVTLYLFACFLQFAKVVAKDGKDTSSPSSSGGDQLMIQVRGRVFFVGVVDGRRKMLLK
jgi:hypothetical protein